MHDVVGIDEEDGVVGVRLGILLEGHVFVIIVHDPAVRHRAADGDAEELTREHCRRRGRAADVGGACAVDGGIDVVRAACAEVGDDAASCSAHDAARLRGDERLVIDLGEDRRLGELRVDDGRGHGEDRLFGVHDRALAEGADVAREAVVREVVEEVLAEERERAQIVDVFGGKVHVLDVFDDLFKPREDGEAAAVGVAAKEHVEGGACSAGLLALAEIAVGHRQLVEIHHHRDVARFKLCHRDRPFFFDAAGAAVGHSPPSEKHRDRFCRAIPASWSKFRVYAADLPSGGGKACVGRAVRMGEEVDELRHFLLARDLVGVRHREEGVRALSAIVV